LLQTVFDTSIVFEQKQFGGLKSEQVLPKQSLGGLSFTCSCLQSIVAEFSAFFSARDGKAKSETKTILFPYRYSVCSVYVLDKKNLYLVQK
jgi:hypothetical protein